MGTLDVVKNLLQNYQLNLNKIKLADSQSEESNLSLKENLGHLKQQMQLLEFSMNCMNEKEKEVIILIYKNAKSLSEVARLLFTCKSNIYKMREKALKNLAKIYDDIKKWTTENEKWTKVND